jgi:hypothetical protein
MPAETPKAAISALLRPEDPEGNRVRWLCDCPRGIPGDWNVGSCRAETPRLPSAADREESSASFASVSTVGDRPDECAAIAGVADEFRDGLM